MFTVGSLQVRADKFYLRDNDSLQYLPNDNEYNIVIAALRGDYSIVESLLEKGVSANSMLEDGTTPLICAARSGNLLICKLLLAKGAMVNYKPVTGNTALIAAIRGGHTQVVDFLIENGADVNLTDDLGRTAFIYAAAAGDSVMIEKLLQHKADPNLKDNSGTDALMASVINRRLNITELLLDRGADVNTADADGVTPLIVSVTNNDYSSIELLLKRGANINAKSKHKETALTIAIAKSDDVMIQYLIKNGANINQRLNFAETPLTIAHYYKHNNFIIGTLEEMGAKQNILPDFRRITFGPEITWNFDDFMIGMDIGTKELKYNLDVTAGIVIRPFSTRILVPIPDSSSAYYQYWEQRNYVFLGLHKNINFKRHNFESGTGITFGLKELYTFSSNFRGSIVNPGAKFILTPEIGIFHNFKGLQLNLVYQYTDFGLTGVSQHRINLSAKIILGRNSAFNNDLYKPWN